MATSQGLRLAPLWWGFGFVGVGIVIALSLIPGVPGLPGDKGGWGGHILAYATMMGWFAQFVRSPGKRLAMGAALCALGVVLEFAQLAMGFRSFDGMDMLADAIGVCVGWLASPPRVPQFIATLDRKLARRMGPAKGSSA